VEVQQLLSQPLSPLPKRKRHQQRRKQENLKKRKLKRRDSTSLVLSILEKTTSASGIVR
jgi:hypothetical protein